MGTSSISYENSEIKCAKNLVPNARGPICVLCYVMAETMIVQFACFRRRPLMLLLHFCKWYLLLPLGGREASCAPSKESGVQEARPQRYFTQGQEMRSFHVDTGLEFGRSAGVKYRGAVRHHVLMRPLWKMRSSSMGLRYIIVRAEVGTDMMRTGRHGNQPLSSLLTRFG